MAQKHSRQPAKGVSPGSPSGGFGRQRCGWALAAVAALPAALTACAGIPYVAPESERQAQPADFVTGSHLTRRGDRSTSAVEADKDALGYNLRNTNGNRDNGK